MKPLFVIFFFPLFPIDKNKTVSYFWTFEKEMQVKSHWEWLFDNAV